MSDPTTEYPPALSTACPSVCSWPPPPSPKRQSSEAPAPPSKPPTGICNSPIWRQPMDDADAVRNLLAAAGFDPPATDLVEIVDAYAMVREMVKLLYSVDAARYESPALRFETEPRFVDWPPPIVRP